MFDWKIFQGKRTNNYPGGNIFEPPEDTPGQRIKIRQLVRFGQIVGVFNKILKEIFIAHVWVGKFFQNKRTNNGGNIFEPPGDTPGERIKIRQLVRFEQIVGMFDKILKEKEIDRKGKILRRQIRRDRRECWRLVKVKGSIWIPLGGV